MAVIARPTSRGFSIRCTGPISWSASPSRTRSPSIVGSLTNPSKLANTLNTVAHAGATDKTVKRYLDALTDAFIFSEVERFDVKGKRYFDYPMKYYATDAGIRNALLNFRQIEETHLMENVIYNELVLRSYAVGVIPFLLRPEILE